MPRMVVVSLLSVLVIRVQVHAAATTDTGSFAHEFQRTGPMRQVLRDGWQLQSSVLVREPDDVVATTDYRPEGWWPTAVPSTVLNALVKQGVYPDPRQGLNAFRIPDSSEEFNQTHDLARFSHLPDRRNPWRDPWWYRTEFLVPSVRPGPHCWLHFDAINYRAEVWLNGARIADRHHMVGMFQRFQFDVTHAVRPGRNVLAVKVYPVDHPGTPDTQLEVFGRDRGYVGKEIMRDVTEIMTIGYDCMMTVPDRNLGLWQDVWLAWTGPVDIRDPFVVTKLPLPRTDQATLLISAELVNASAGPVQGVLRGSIPGTGVHFEHPVALDANTTKVVTVDPRPVMQNPRLWWPVNYGEQSLYRLELGWAVKDGPDQHEVVSDTEEIRFGVREVGYEMHERDGYAGRRVLVNGQKILCRGGYMQPELLLDWDARRMETEVRYYATAHLNLVYFEDIPNPPEPFLDLCDRYGVLFGNVFYSCYWLRPGTPYPDDFSLLERCTADLVKRYRNHPSLLFYMAMNEEDTKQDVYEMWRRHILALDGTRWFIPSAYFPSDRQNVPAWFQKDLPAGMTDKGASYSWAEPEQYFRWVREAGNWMFMMEGGSASLPPISSLSRFLPEVSGREPAGGPQYPLNEDWAHHGANHYYQGYDSALRRLHGTPRSVVDYCWKGHLVTAEQHRAMFEAVNHRMWDITSGFTQWKINACEPSIQWQIFDWFHKPMVSYFYIRKACEPLHVQLNLLDHVVSVINGRLQPQPDLTVTARVFDLEAKQLWQQTTPLGVPANSYREAFAITDLPDLAPLVFVKLELKDARGQLVSHNWYWLRGRGVNDYGALQSLPLVKLDAASQTEDQGEETLTRVKVTNPSRHIAFFIQVALTDGEGGEVLPVFWEDNYFSLLPGESREVTARVPRGALSRTTPRLQIGGWNIRSEFACARLEVASPRPRAGQPFLVQAAVSHTFLDGSRIPLEVDGRTAATQWCWARDEAAVLNFSICLEKPGPHTLKVGSQSLTVDLE